MGVEDARSASGSEEITAGPESRAHLREMLLIGLVSSVVGIAVGLLIDWFPVDASEQAGPIDTMWDVLLIFSVPVFVLVEVVVLYSVWRFHMRPGEELKDGPPIHGNTRLEIIWTAIPAILLVCLCSYAYIVLTDIEEAEARALDVRVVGEQFTWTFHYRGPDGQDLASPQLYVPVDRQVNFTVQSKDVLHDFWVPAFRMKIDAVRGHRHAPPRHADAHRPLPGGLRGAVRDRPLRHAPDGPRGRAGGLRHVAAGARRAARGRRRRRRGGGGRRRRRGGRRRRRSSPRPAAGTATRWPTRTPRATSARTWTTRSPTRTTPSSASRSSTRTPRSRAASPRASCPWTTSRRWSRRRSTRSWSTLPT